MPRGLSVGINLAKSTNGLREASEVKQAASGFQRIGAVWRNIVVHLPRVVYDREVDKGKPVEHLHDLAWGVNPVRIETSAGPPHRDREQKVTTLAQDPIQLCARL